MMPGAKWSAHESCKLLDLWPTHSCAEIAERLGRSYDAVHQRSQLYGLRKSARVKSEIYRRSAIRRPRGFMVKPSPVRNPAPSRQGSPQGAGEAL